MKTMLLNASDDLGWSVRFQVALDLARAFEAHLSCVQVVPYHAAVGGDGTGGLYVSPVLIEELQDIAQTHQDKVEARLRREDVAWDWMRLVGDPAAVLIERAGLVDLVIITTSAAPLRESAAGDLGPAGAICTHARGPVLATPPELESFDSSGPALVAWNGSMESAHAVRLGVPMLARSREVHILTIVEEDALFPAADVCAYLSRQGIRAEVHARDRKSEPAGIADCIMETARALNANYIVAGAYGHSRFREAVFGGVTRDLLRKSERPLLLAH